MDASCPHRHSCLVNGLHVLAQGVGGFGSVFEATWRGKPVAVKVHEIQHPCLTFPATKIRKPTKCHAHVIPIAATDP